MLSFVNLWKDRPLASAKRLQKLKQLKACNLQFPLVWGWAISTLGAMNTKAWVKASRLPSQTYIAFPILLGQMLFVAQGGSFSIVALIVAQLYGIFDQLYIVYANDWADWKTDQTNSTFNMFSGGSRVLVDGDISREALGRAAAVMAGLAAGVSVVGALLTGNWIIAPLGIIGLLLLWAYSFKPFLLSYRGGGELLQTIGVGGVLPLMGYLIQGGQLTAFPWEILAATLPISLACAITTSLPDEPSDRASSKRTASVILGTKGAQILASVLAAASLASWFVLDLPAMGLAGALIPVAIAGVLLLLSQSAHGAKPGSAKLNGFVTALVASNIFFFLAGSIVLGI